MKKPLLAAFCCLLPAGGAVAQDPLALEKWTKAKTIFYRLEGSYSAKTLISEPNGGAWADVTDRVAVDFEWDLRNMKLVRVVRLENAPSKASNVRQMEPTCAPPLPRGAYEHWTVLEVASGLSGQLEMKVETTIPDVDTPQFCTGKPKAFKGRKNVRPEEVSVLSPIFLGMPLGASSDVKVSDDRKSLVMKKDGWTWTFTPSLTKPSA